MTVCALTEWVPQSSDASVGHVVSPDFWAGQPLPLYWVHTINCCCLVTKLCPILLWLHGLQPIRLLCPDFPGYRSGLPFPSAGGPSWPRDRTYVSCIGRWILYTEPPGKPNTIYILILIHAMPIKWLGNPETSIFEQKLCERYWPNH